MGSMLTLYHGSNVIVKNPQVLTNGFYKDFGYGFYCTNLEKQAQRWGTVNSFAQISSDILAEV